MKRIICLIVFVFLVLSLTASPAQSAEAQGKKQQSAAKQNTLSKDPYLGAILIDAATGKVLFEDNPDVKASPASIVKLMNLLIILEGVKNNSISLEDTVTINAEAAGTGGSQVYLKEREVFTVDELLYALIVQSGNDAAVALATHVAGTKDAFVDLMNKKARQLGMRDTIFSSVHGLPPAKGQQPDISTPRDIAKLCLELLKWKDVLRYTSVKERSFRADSGQPFIMRTHNHLLKSFEGCDGFKTGYYRAAGFSIAATALKKEQRAIAVVFGSENRLVRDAKTKELLARGLAELIRTAPKQTAAVVPAPAEQKKTGGKPEEKDVIQISTRTLKIIGVAIAGFILLLALVAIFKGRKKRDFMND